jgi:hypothetical protein
MFVLHPGGTGGSAGAPSQVRTNLWFFGKLGLYYTGLRLAFVFMSGRESPKSVERE